MLVGISGFRARLLVSNPVLVKKMKVRHNCGIPSTHSQSSPSALYDHASQLRLPVVVVSILPCIVLVLTNA